MIVPVAGKLTSNFYEPRPLSNPGKHPHGAVDISAAIGTPIYAPESGTVFCYTGIRKEEKTYWPNPIPKVHGKPFPFRNYFYDMYGGIIVLQAHNGNPEKVTRTHIIAHSYGSQIFNKSIFNEYRSHWVEETEDERFPFHAMYTEYIIATEGTLIGFVGNAGYSTGAHVHWEIHHGFQWEEHKNRVNPERYFL